MSNMMKEENMDQTEFRAEEAREAAEAGTKEPGQAGAENPQAGTKEPEQAGAEPGDKTGEAGAESPQAEAAKAGAETTGAESTVDAPEQEQSSEEEEELSARYMRLAADFQNYRRRVEKEKTDLYAYANEQLVTQLLDVIDNFERALEADSEGEGFREGMKMIFQQLMAVLERAGLEEIKAHGEDFDPNFHNAVLTGDDPEFGSGKVTEVMQKGYTLKGKLIRPSMVKVNN